MEYVPFTCTPTTIRCDSCSYLLRVSEFQVLKSKYGTVGAYSYLGIYNLCCRSKLMSMYQEQTSLERNFLCYRNQEGLATVNGLATIFDSPRQNHPIPVIDDQKIVSKYNVLTRVPAFKDQTIELNNGIVVDMS